MKAYTIYSAQTGTKFGEFAAANEQAALDLFAQSYGYANRSAMWKAGAFEYASAA